MQTIDAIAQILKQEGIEYLSAFPTTPVIEAAATVGIRPIICRQERVGVGIGDGYARVKNGRPPGVFAMQYGPGAENAFAGVATAFSDAVPILIHDPGIVAGIVVRPVELVAAAVLDSDCLGAIEEHARGESVELDLERMVLGDR